MSHMVGDQGFTPFCNAELLYIPSYVEMDLSLFYSDQMVLCNHLQLFFNYFYGN